MQLTGPGVFGPPPNRDEAIAVLRTAVEIGVNHIDAAEYYGPKVVNELVREALYPYPVGFQNPVTGSELGLLRNPFVLVDQPVQKCQRRGVAAYDRSMIQFVHSRPCAYGSSPPSDT
jgi:hypothetical protein